MKKHFVFCFAFLFCCLASAAGSFAAESAPVAEIIFCKDVTKDGTPVKPGNKLPAGPFVMILKLDRPVGQTSIRTDGLRFFLRLRGGTEHDVYKSAGGGTNADPAARQVALKYKLLRPGTFDVEITTNDTKKGVERKVLGRGVLTLTK